MVSVTLFFIFLFLTRPLFFGFGEWKGTVRIYYMEQMFVASDRTTNLVGYGLN